ncbi:unnamed protein product [Staurois parvus]|uniref:ADP-ribosylation factor-like protein 2-binding protein n=1 Tax=Staurois parvus TaxID=386267 RepID=A0ABN9DPG7_9NEOB|nr:unnamed protein product [Staurois parvus]
MMSSRCYKEILWTSIIQSLRTQKENKLTYTPIFNEYICLVEKFIEEQLLKRIPTFNMSAFISTLQSHRQEMAGDIFDILLTFTDFLAFKEMFLDYKAVSVLKRWAVFIKTKTKENGEPLGLSIAYQPSKIGFCLPLATQIFTYILNTLAPLLWVDLYQ